MPALSVSDTAESVRQVAAAQPVLAHLPSGRGRAVLPLHIFTGALRTPPGLAYRTLLGKALGGDGRGAAMAYLRLFGALLPENWAGDAWRAHVATAVARDANAFTLGAAPGPGLRGAAEQDLETLERIADGEVLERLRRALEDGGYPLAPCRDLGMLCPSGVAAEMAASTGWSRFADALCAHARSGGAGPLAAPLAHRWDPAPGGSGRVVPIAHPDLPTESELFGYIEERAVVYQNTERFLRRLPANDMLLYGDRGTGKSTTVKSLLTRYGDRGLRLIELGRRHLADLPRVYDALDGAPQRCVIFVDDLSFEENETEYKDAKAALQGGLRARPANVVVYATSNRRHLVRERLSERADPGDDDPRAGDAVEEKLSLADRFGLTVVFASPDQELYLGIVRHLAGARALPIGESELRARALRWALWHNGRSARAAHQFVDALQGELLAGGAP